MDWRQKNRKDRNMEIKDKYWSKIEKELQANENLWSKPDGKEHDEM